LKGLLVHSCEIGPRANCCSRTELNSVAMCGHTQSIGGARSGYARMMTKSIADNRSQYPSKSSPAVAPLNPSSVNQTLSSLARLVSFVKLTAPSSVDDSNGAPVCASAKRGDASFISFSLRSVTYRTLHRVRTRSATYEPLERAATGHCHIIVFAGLLRNSVNRVSEPVEDGRGAFTF
jgi:hypothetical protein